MEEAATLCCRRNTIDILHCGSQAEDVENRGDGNLCYDSTLAATDLNRTRDADFSGRHSFHHENACCSPWSDCQKTTRLQHRRSFSWGSSVRIPSLEIVAADACNLPNRCLTSSQYPPSTDTPNPDNTKSSSVNTVPPFHSSERNKLINKIRNDADMRLDLDSVEKCGPYMDGDLEVRQRKERMEECDKACSRILSYLFVGGSTVAQNLKMLQYYRITHIINCVGFLCPEYFPNEFEYKTLWLQDSPNEDVGCILYDVIDYIENARKQCGGCVFVHCCQGVSRSAALVIAYLMWQRHECFEDAFYEVKSSRNVASPNMGFVAQLMQWQHRILDPPDRHAFQMYRIVPQSAYDPLYLVPKLVFSHYLSSLDSRGAFIIQMANKLYIWRGLHCDKEMVRAADRFAFQLIHYEHAQGPIILIHEGREPQHVLTRLRQLQENDLGDEHHERELNKQLNTDYEMYQRAQAGGYVPPLLSSDIIIRLPVKSQQWNHLRASLLDSPRQHSGKF